MRRRRRFASERGDVFLRPLRSYRLGTPVEDQSRIVTAQPDPDGKVKDKGSGGERAKGALGAAVLTDDVVVQIETRLT
jgi:hypothetical protein